MESETHTLFTLNGQTVSDRLPAQGAIEIEQTVLAKFALNWSHYVENELPEDANIHASEYQFYMPSKEELKKNDGLGRGNGGG